MSKNFFKKITCILAACAVAITSSTFSAIASDGLQTKKTISVAEENKCGENAYWELSDDGTLTISGEGGITDFSSDSLAPWYEQRELINSVTIQEGITSVGVWAFKDCSNVKQLIIPDSVNNIGIGAFYGCKELVSIDLPDSLTRISKAMFSNCILLKSIIIPDSVTSIAPYAFDNCSDLESVIMPYSVTQIGFSAFSFCPDLKSITILNPSCEIDSIFGVGAVSKTLIKGYRDSTAELFADNNDFSFESIDAPSFGDLNNDGIINAVDASYILILYASITAGQTAVTESDIMICDINGDNLINAVDASSVLRYYAYISDGNAVTLSEFMSGAFLPDNVPGEIPFDIDSIPSYSGNPYVIVNDNIPYFDPAEYQSESFEYYSPLDLLGRCSICMACISEDIMPTEDRGEIGNIKPTGWHTIRYDDIIKDKYLYNRCHLIGYQLTAENANMLNLITGTRYLNIEGMLTFENMTANYIKSTHNHVLYRSTPVFIGDELVCRGVLMEAYSLEDKGKGICFNVFCYNVQPGIEINYADGDSKVSENTTVTTTTTTTATTTTQTTTTTTTTATSTKRTTTTTRTTATTTTTTTIITGTITFVINKNTKRFHRTSCSDAGKISPENRKDSCSSREEIIAEGYVPCKKCNP